MMSVCGLHVPVSCWRLVLQGLNDNPAGSGQATLAGSPSAGGSSWAALADSALPQGPLLEEAAPADVEVSRKSLVAGVCASSAAADWSRDGLACNTVCCYSSCTSDAACTLQQHSQFPS